MIKKYLSIQEASELSKKSIQTIRRALKSGKIKYKKQKTPQGFNYLITQESLFQFYNIRMEKVGGEELSSKKSGKAKKSLSHGKVHDVHISYKDFESFTASLEKVIAQHSDERQNFLRLISTLQEKIFVLENQLNLLKAPQRRWYQFWR